MNWVDIFQIWLMAFLTLALFSFMYKDNPFYKIAEHIFAGMSAGYYVGLIWHSVILQTMWEPMTKADNPSWWLFIPGLLGVMMFSRFSSKHSWVSRIPLAFVMAVTSGIFLTSQLHGLVLPQMQDTMIPATERVAMVADQFANNSGILSIYDSQELVSDSGGISEVDTVTDTLIPDSSVEIAIIEEWQIRDSADLSLSITGGSLSTTHSKVDKYDTTSTILRTEFKDSEPLGFGEFYSITFSAQASDGSGDNIVIAQSDVVSDDGITIEELMKIRNLKKVSVRFDPPNDLPTGQYDLSVEIQRRSVEFLLFIVVIIGVLSTLIYFYFSKPHTGALGITAKVGIWFIMISFGAHFGYTVMGRVSLLIGRVQFLIVDWIGSFV